MTNILGILACYHDNAAALERDGDIILTVVNNHSEALNGVV
jgi:predicted NodU family carbamoyl transferase